MNTTSAVLGISFAVNGPFCPPPGGVTLGSSGSSGSGSGKTYRCSGFDTSAYSQFYSGPMSILDVNNSTDGPAASMSFAGAVPLPTRVLPTVSGLAPVLGFKNSQSTFGNTVQTAGFGFFSTPPASPAPEPGTMTLVGAGAFLVGLARVGRSSGERV